VKKHEVQSLLDTMPDEIDAEQLIYTLYLKYKLERAEADIAAGRLTPHEEVERLMAEWLK
jgi:predicted transcriptional regulator